MTPEQVIALLALLADLRLQVGAMSAENAELRRRLELATGGVQSDGESLADLARSMA